MTITIYPSSPKPEQKPYLVLLFKQQHGTIFWSAAKYVVTTNNGPVEISLKYPIVTRESKKGGLRYDVMSFTKLGSGSSGDVYLSNRTLKIDEQNELHVKEKKQGNERAIKMMHLVDPQKDPRLKRTTEQIIKEAEEEFALCQAVPHLHAKKPVWNKTHLFIVMRRLYGKELFDVLADDSGSQFLSILKRFNLTFAVIDALQVIFNCGLVHSDIKPENFIVKMIGDAIEAFAIDLGYAKRIESNRLKDDRGSILYASPELMNGMKTSQLTDVYSLGRILCLIWRVNYRVTKFSEAHTVTEMIAWAKNSDYSSLCSGLNDLNPNAKLQIQFAIATTLSFEPEERILEHPLKINGKAIVNLGGLRKEFEAAYNLQFPASESATVEHVPVNKTTARRSLDQIITLGSRLNPRTSTSHQRSSLTEPGAPLSTTPATPTPPPDFIKNNNMGANLRSGVKQSTSKIKAEIKPNGKETSNYGKKLLKKVKKAGNFFLGSPKEKRKSVDQPPVPPTVENEHNKLPPD